MPLNESSTLHLTQNQQEMLSGLHGEAVAYAMRIQVGMGRVFGAKRMVPVTRTHVALSAQDAYCWFVEKMVSMGGRCKISPTVNPSIDLNCLSHHLAEIPAEGHDIVNQTNEGYRKIGATLTFDCTSYFQQNVPAFGEVIAFSESSATPYVNSVIGARTNRESSQSALCAAIGAWLRGFSSNPLVLLMMINVFLLVIGCFVDNIAAVIILTPILLPVVKSLGVDPIHFGLIITVNLACGFISPPYGINLFVASAISGESIEKISIAIIPSFIAMVLCLLLFTYFPSLSLGLLTLLR